VTAGGSGVIVGEEAGERGLPVGPGRDKPEPAGAAAENHRRQQARGGRPAAEPERPRRHGEPRAVGEHGDERGDVTALKGVSEPVDDFPSVAGDVTEHPEGPGLVEPGTGG
jgi:hypothetical protein